jgi:S-DNA-T family DNA segregation ATPase FtsK/SpoIIIE
MDAATVGALVWVGVPSAAGAWWYYRHRTPKVDRWTLLLAQWEQIAKAAGIEGARLENPRGNAWGWQSDLKLRPAQTAKDAVRAIPGLESALQTRVGAVRVEENRARADLPLLRVVERDPHAQPIPWPGPSAASILEPIELGLYETGEPVKVRFAYRHSLIVGMPDFGKSALESLLIANFAAMADVAVWGVDFNAGVEFEPWRRVLGRMATDEREGKALLGDAVSIIHQRSRLLAASGLRKWQPTPQAPALIIPVDEQAMVAEHQDLIDLEDVIGTLGRKVLVLLVAALQRGTQDSIGSKKLRQLMDNRFCLRVAEGAEVDLAFDKGARDAGWNPDRLTRPGQFYVRAGGQGLVTPRPARAYWVDDARVRAVAAEWGGRQPVIRERSPDERPVG